MSLIKQWTAVAGSLRSKMQFSVGCDRALFYIDEEGNLRPGYHNGISAKDLPVFTKWLVEIQADDPLVSTQKEKE